MKIPIILFSFVAVCVLGWYGTLWFFNSCYGDYSCYRFETYEEFKKIKTESPTTLGKRGNIGEALSLESVPPCAEDILYKFDLDSNKGSLEFDCQEPPDMQALQNYWKLNRVEGTRYYFNEE